MTIRALIQRIVLVCLLPLMVAQGAFAEELKVDVKTADPILSTLETLVGKSVTLKLRSGVELSGTLAAVATGGAHLTQLKGGMEFFDAVVRLDEISAVIARAR